MGKVIKLNRSGTVGMSIDKTIAAGHGLVPGTDITQEWSPELNALVVKIASKPSEPAKAISPSTVVESL